MTALPPMSELIPHAGPMILVDELLSWEPGVARCQTRVRKHAPFVVDGKVDVTVTVEYMAQAVAACLGHEALLGGDGVRVGMVIGCKTFTAHQAFLEVDDEVQIDVRRMGGNETLSHFACEVERNGAPFSSGTLTLFHPTVT